MPKPGVWVQWVQERGNPKEPARVERAREPGASGAREPVAAGAGKLRRQVSKAPTPVRAWRAALGQRESGPKRTESTPA